jgi:D-alanyl-lipoteichoic acid acyltransferase DltB (MBOAT superfamily)
MLFNSYEFILLFLPISLLGYALVSNKVGQESALSWLVLCSLFFYGWWNPAYLILIIISMVANFWIGASLSKFHQSKRLKTSGLLLAIGVSINLGLLGYYKYSNFFIDSLNTLVDTGYSVEKIILPLAISFFTFQQVAYLVDAKNGLTKEYRFSHYALFVTFFPQLIAGPIVHHKEMLPQFMQSKRFQIRAENIVIGLTIFFIGLFKKTVLADGIAQYASPVFQASAEGEAVTLFIAWGGALAYTFQLYFDFSGYSDMAIGAARLFGIKLPLNFHSPYKAANIIEFWRRWHITLSRFLRDYLYIALGGNKKGSCRRYANLFITMLLGGLWHGAGWNFVIWGALHGFYLSINHLWNRIKPQTTTKPLGLNIGKAFAWLITFLAVIIGWVFFRAIDLNSALLILKGMAGLNGISIPNAIAAHLGSGTQMLESFGIRFTLGGGAEFMYTYLWILFLFLVAIFFPNTQEIMAHQQPVLSQYKSSPHESVNSHNFLSQHFIWRASRIWVWITAFTAALGLLSLSKISEFLYFQF